MDNEKYSKQITIERVVMTLLEGLEEIGDYIKKNEPSERDVADKINDLLDDAKFALTTAFREDEHQDQIHLFTTTKH